MMLINPFVYNSIDEYTKSWMLFSTLDDLVVDNTWSGGTLTGGKLVGSTAQNTLADQSRFNINTGDFTIEFDYTPDATDNNGSNHGLLSFSQDSLASVSYFIRYNAGLMMVSYPSAGGSAEIPVYNTTALTTGQEYHVVFQRKAGVYDLLVDSVSNTTPQGVIDAVNYIVGRSDSSIEEMGNAHLKIIHYATLTTLQEYFLRGLSSIGSIIPLPICVSYEIENSTLGYGHSYGYSYGKA